MQRTLQPELLDSLPHDHPDALHNRRDLRLTNAVVGNPRWFARILPALLRPGEVALELGAGTGELGAVLRKTGVAVDGLDLWGRPAAWPPERQWHAADLRTFCGYAAYPVIIANLVLHQFPDEELRSLGARWQTARVIVASEPARRRVSQVLYRALAPLLGANHVSLHDAHVSIAAGFRRDELPCLLGLDPLTWAIRCRVTWLGIYRMVAVRRS
jgi:hypothetical protein